MSVELAEEDAARVRTIGLRRDAARGAVGVETAKADYARKTTILEKSPFMQHVASAERKLVDMQRSSPATAEVLRDLVNAVKSLGEREEKLTRSDLEQQKKGAIAGFTAATAQYEEAKVISPYPEILQSQVEIHGDREGNVALTTLKEMLPDLAEMTPDDILNEVQSGAEQGWQAGQDRAGGFSADVQPLRRGGAAR